jgi:UDP-N-acetylmuramoyl-tripeptide--D-alanyl-D-alanine ligase
MKAKYELIEALPKNGLALFNGNNTLSLELFKKTEKKKALYSVVKKGAFGSADIKATHVVSSKQGTSFTVAKGKKILKFKTPLLGAHNVENILPGIYLALTLGMKDEDIIFAVANLKAMDRTMIRGRMQNGTATLDCTFNANPATFPAVFDYMNHYGGRKILVVAPMIELGKLGRLEHYKVGYNAGMFCDVVYVTNKNFYNDIAKGIEDSGKKCKLYADSPKDIAKRIREKTGRTSDSVVAFVGREAGGVLRKIK